VSPGSSANSTDLRVREARAGDAEAVALLLGELGYPSNVADVKERMSAALADPSSHLLVAVSGSEVRGFASACLMPFFPNGSQILRITALTVAEGARRSRVGSVLIEHADELARQLGASALEVTAAERRRGAHAFYQNLGFARTSSRYFRPT
jgi:GNAT superfamily N-acetyltransferase